jgi:hypothetical protein
LACQEFIDGVELEEGDTSEVIEEYYLCKSIAQDLA